MKRLLLLAGLLAVAYTNSDARPDGYNFASTGGCNCHNVNPSTVSTVTLTPSATKVKPGEVINFKFSLTDGGTNRSGGFGFVLYNSSNVTSGSGVAGQGSKILGRQIVHSSAKSFANAPNRTVEWEFGWTAPTATGVYRAIAIGNAATGENRGNWRYITPLEIIVSDEPNSVPEIEEVPLSIFPNPTFGLTKIEIPSEYRQSELSITSSNGVEVFRTTIEGEEVIAWNGRTGVGEEVPNGVYLIALTSSERRRVQKIIVMR
jgi:hypothetical protein